MIDVDFQNQSAVFVALLDEKIELCNIVKTWECSAIFKRPVDHFIVCEYSFLTK